MTTSIAADVKARTITRLCHITAARNLPHIFGDGLLLSRKQLEEDLKVMNPNDNLRLDGYPDHVCCSIEYPNAWYLDKIRDKDPNFKEWVVLFLSPDLLWSTAARFFDHNAASKHSVARTGLDGLRSLYAHQVVGGRGINRRRGEMHLRSCPTDDQAEVLIPGAVPISAVRGICFPTEVQAQDELSSFDMFQLQAPRCIICPRMFEKYVLSAAIRAGKRVPEQIIEVRQV